ncbi:MAG: serine hydrolase [Pseudomonadota bacterium]
MFVLCRIVLAGLLTGAVFSIAPVVAEPPPKAEHLVFSRYIAHADRDTFRQLHNELKGTGFVPVSAQSPANSHYNVVWHKDYNIDAWRFFTKMSRSDYEKRRDDLRSKGFRRAFLTGYSDDGRERYNGIWVKEKVDRKRRTHSKLSKKELAKKLVAYEKDGYTPTDIMPWRHKKRVYYSAVWIKDNREVAWALEVSLKDWEKTHKLRRKQGYSLRDIGMLGASKRSGVRFSGVWVKNSKLRTHYRRMLVTEGDLVKVLRGRIKENYRVSDLDSAYVGGKVHFSVLLHRPAGRNKLRANFELDENVEVSVRSLLENYRKQESSSGADNVGFYIENYQTGKFVAYNPNEHYFMSSTRKVLLAAASMQEGFQAGNRRTVDLDLVDYRYDARDAGRSRGGVSYPSINRRSLSTPFTPSHMLAAMLVESDNTAADYFYNNWAGKVEMRRMLRSLGTSNFGEMIGKCDQYTRSLSLKPGYADFKDVRCHVLRAWMLDQRNGLRRANSKERKILKDKNASRSVGLWRAHIDRHFNALTPRTYARFFEALADGEVLTRNQRGDLLRHMVTSSRFSGRQFTPRLFDGHAAKNGRTHRNKSWVVFTWDFLNGNSDYTSIDPKQGYVFFSEDHSDPGEDGNDGADNLSQALYVLLMPQLE